MRAVELKQPSLLTTAEALKRCRFVPMRALSRCLNGRKGPHRLVLVQATADGVPETRPNLSLAPRPAAQVAPELAFYRKYTEALLRRYMKMALEVGRVPSLLGRELFRGQVSHCRVSSFEDCVIFVHDVEGCINQLSPGQQHLLRRIALQEYTQGETSAMLGISLRTVVRRYADSLDQLSRVLLEKGILRHMTARPEAVDGLTCGKSCQAPAPSSSVASR